MCPVQVETSALAGGRLFGSAVVSIGLLMAGVAGCDDSEPNLPTEPPEVTVPGASPVDPAIPGPDDRGDGNTGTRYTCEGGWNVAVSGDVARVTAGDGRVIELQRVADRSPPLFAGEALEFSVNGDGAVLGQDEGGPFACEESG